MTPQYSPKNPCKILLISEDQAESTRLDAHLNEPVENVYKLNRFLKLDLIQSIDLGSFCDLVLVDLRLGIEKAKPFVDCIGQLYSPAPMIALCSDHKELEAYGESCDYFDDYVLVDDLRSGELAARIEHTTRLRQSKYSLIQEKNLLEALLETIPDAIYFKNRESQFLKVNKAMAEHYGKAETDLIGKSDHDLYTEEHARPAYEDELHILKTGESLVGKIEKVTQKTGDIEWVSTTKMPLRDLKGEIIGTMGISRGVTELKKTQDKLEQERALLKVIFDHASAGIFVKDAKGTFIMVNQKHADYIGAKSPEEVEGKTIDDFLDPEIAKKVDAADRLIMETGVPREGLIDHREVPGRPESWLMTSKVPLMNDDGTCRGMVGISIDLTREKETEKALKDAIATLEETKLQLIEAEKLKSVGRMAAGVAHEVKNPLNIISLGIEFLSKQIKEPAEAIETIEDMSSAIDRANEVIFELLDYSAPHEFSKDPVDLNKITEHSLALLRHNLGKADIKIESDLDEDLPLIEGDAAKLEQVLVNLCLNASSAMKSGGTLSVRTYAHKMKHAGSNVSSEMTECFRIGDQVVSLEIADTGHGIDKKNKDKLFDPFFSTKSTGENTGLGLSVTRNIVEMHGGCITLENREEGPGAVATVNLPASDRSDA